MCNVTQPIRDIGLMTFFCHYLLCLVKPVIISFNPYPHTKIGEEVWINCSAHGRPIPTLKWRRDKSNFDLIHGVQPDSKFDIVTLPSITSVTKETLIVCKVSILRNSALNHLKLHDLPFLVACTRLYNPLCPSVGRSVCLSHFTFFYDFIL